MEGLEVSQVVVGTRPLFFLFCGLKLEQLEHHLSSNVLLPPAPIKFAMLRLRSIQMLCMKHEQ